MKYCTGKYIFAGLFLLLQVLDLGDAFFIKYKQQELELNILGSLEKMVKMITNFNYPETGGVRCLREEFADKIIETIQSSVSCQIHRFGPLKKIFIHNGIINDRFDDCAVRAKAFINDILLQNAPLRDCHKKWSKNYSIGIPIYNKKIYYLTFNDGLLVSKKVSGSVARDPAVPSASGGNFDLGTGSIIVRKRRDIASSQNLDSTGIFRALEPEKTRRESTNAMFPWYPTKHALPNRRMAPSFTDPWLRSYNTSSNSSTTSENSYERVKNWIRDQINNHCHTSFKRSESNQSGERLLMRHFLSCFEENENVLDDLQLQINIEICDNNIGPVLRQSSNNMQSNEDPTENLRSLEDLTNRISNEVGRVLPADKLKDLKESFDPSAIRKQIIKDLRLIRSYEAENKNNSPSSSSLSQLKDELKNKVCQYGIIKPMNLIKKIEEKVISNKDENSKADRRFENPFWGPINIPQVQNLEFPPFDKIFRPEFKERVVGDVGLPRNILAHYPSLELPNSHRNRIKKLGSDTWLKFDDSEENHLGLRKPESLINDPQTLRTKKNIEFNIMWLLGHQKPKVNIYSTPNRNFGNFKREEEPQYWVPSSHGKKLKFDSSFPWLPKSRAWHNDEESNEPFPFENSKKSEVERGVLCLLKSPKNQYSEPFSSSNIELSTLKCIFQKPTKQPEEKEQNEEEYLQPDHARQTTLLEKLKQYEISSPFIGPKYSQQQPHFSFTLPHLLAPPLNSYPDTPFLSTFPFVGNPSPPFLNSLPSHPYNDYQNSNPFEPTPHQEPFGSDQDQYPFGSSQDQNPIPSSQDQNPLGSSQGQNPFGSIQSQNPFGSTQSQNPFGSSQGQNPFGSTQSQNPFGSSQDQNPFGSNQDENPKELFRDYDTKPLYQDQPSDLSQASFPKIRISLSAYGRRKKRSLENMGPQLRQGFGGYYEGPMIQPNTLWFDRPTQKLTSTDPVFMTENDIYRRSLRNYDICGKGMQVGKPGEEVRRIEICGGEMEVGNPETQVRRSDPKTITRSGFSFPDMYFTEPLLGAK